jgi:hypothetical protein
MEFPTMKIMVATFVMAVALLGCSKKKADTTPTNNTSGTATEMKSDGSSTDGSSTGGTTYGGATTAPAGDGADQSGGM